MKKVTFPLLLLLILARLLAPSGASAAELRLFVNEFTVNAQAPADLKATLRALLSTRLAGDGLRTVDSAAEADLVISGSFSQFGKVFSLDAVAKNRSGETLISSFEQGEGADTLIPAVGKLANRLKAGLASPARVQAPPPAAKVAPASAEIVQAPTASLESERIAGAQCALAPGKRLEHGRELVVAEGNAIRLFRQDGKLSQLSEVKLPLRQKLIALDTGEGREGSLFVYATIIDDGQAASRIYTVAGGTLQLSAQDLPYLFRSLALSGTDRKVYAQRLGRDGGFEGDLLEASFEKGSLQLLHPVGLPRYANIFNFVSFRDRAGQPLFAALSQTGSLLVYSEKGEELWKSTDKFGGSEISIRLPDSHRRSTLPFSNNRFIEQRITVTEQGELLVPQNTGFLVSDQARSYSHSSLVALAWNGSSLEERWRTKQNDNYLADYHYEPRSRELVLLEVTQHEGLFSKGASALRIIPVE